jgi:UPF0716 protein FxsA
MRLIIMLLPWLELFTLIQLGVETSALTALGYVFITFALGIMVLRWQGMDMFERLRGMQGGRVLGPQMLMDDMATGLAGLLLMFPGMISDVAAVLVLIGPLRRRLASRFYRGERAEAYRPQRDQQANEHTTIEGSFQRLDD